jgi:PhnB protein
MPERTLADRLDDAIQAALAARPMPEAQPEAKMDRELEPYVSIARALRDLPRPSFRARLKGDLLRRTTMSVEQLTAVRQTATPRLRVKNAPAAIEFYKKAFGAEEIQRMPAPDGRIMHAAIRIGKSIVFLVDDFPEFCGGTASTPTALKGTPVTLHHYVESCDAAIKRAQDAGATVVMPAADMFWGDRYGVVTDPYGHKWTFGTRIKDMTPAEMQAAMKDAFAQKH